MLRLRSVVDDRKGRHRYLLSSRMRCGTVLKAWTGSSAYLCSLWLELLPDQPIFDPTPFEEAGALEDEEHAKLRGSLAYDRKRPHLENCGP